MAATAFAAMALMPVAEVDHFLRQKGLNCSQSAYSDKYTLGLPWEGIKIFSTTGCHGHYDGMAALAAREQTGVTHTYCIGR
jgi:hypothetical protein